MPFDPREPLNPQGQIDSRALRQIGVQAALAGAYAPPGPGGYLLRTPQGILASPASIPGEKGDTWNITYNVVNVTVEGDDVTITIDGDTITVGDNVTISGDTLIINDIDIFYDIGPFIDIVTNVDILILTGIVAQPGRILFLHNKGPGLLKLLHEDERSEAANRIITWTRSEQVYAECQTAILYYAIGLTRWLVLTDSNAYQWWDHNIQIFLGGNLDPGQYSVIGLVPGGDDPTVLQGIGAREDGAVLLIYNALPLGSETRLEVSGLHPESKTILKAGESCLLVYNAATPGWLILLSSALMGASGDNAQRGLVPKPPDTEGTENFLREDATWAIPVGSIIVAQHDPDDADNPSPIVEGVRALRPVHYEDVAGVTGLKVTQYTPNEPDLVQDTEQVLLQVDGLTWSGTWVTAVSCVDGNLSVTTVTVTFKNGLLQSVT